METLRGLLLCGGRRTRLRPLTYTSAKQLIPVANRPIVHFALEQVAGGGITEVGIIISPEATVEGSVIRGPSVIGERCRIQNAFIGPYTAIGDDTVVSHTSIQHLVVLDHCHLEGVDRLEDSVLGRGVAITRSADTPQALRVFVSDDSQITL
jgi:glucose-1-phosphate thymidylyltransferase